jgi:hypothetical protein
MTSLVSDTILDSELIRLVSLVRILLIDTIVLVLT